jgi:secondary thiamine-phosphate synthase enzyme
MRQEFFNLELSTNGQSLYDFTNQTKKWVKDQEFNNGIINISIMHTSASLIIQENADSDVQIDLINFFNKLVPMDNSLYAHAAEGKDDMPAHIKSMLTNNQISLSVKNTELLLGIWQGLYLFEHRIEKQKRLIVLHYLGD